MTINETAWIPVSERLPDETGAYLTVMQVGAEISYQVSTFNTLDDGKFFSRYVVAWMPLPEPYRIEEAAPKAADEREVCECGESVWAHPELDYDGLVGNGCKAYRPSQDAPTGGRNDKG